MKILFFIQVLLINLSSSAFGQDKPYFWTDEETSAIKKEDCLKYFPNPNFVSTAISDEINDKFELFYFTLKPFDKNLKTILYLDGGPGNLAGVPFNPSRFQGISHEYNIVHFHIRGGGCSDLPRSNLYDQYIRTENVIKDIEKIREVIGIDSWDLVHGLSYGTVLGQIYANKFPTHIKKLLLEGFVNQEVPSDITKQSLINLLGTLHWKEFSNLRTSEELLIKVFTEVQKIFMSIESKKIDGTLLTQEEINLVKSILNTNFAYSGYSRVNDKRIQDSTIAAKRIVNVFIPNHYKVERVIVSDHPLLRKLTTTRTLMSINVYDGLHEVIVEYLSKGVEFSALLSAFKNSTIGKVGGGGIPFKELYLPKNYLHDVETIIIHGESDGVLSVKGVTDYMKDPLVLQNTSAIILKKAGHQFNLKKGCLETLAQIFLLKGKGEVASLLEEGQCMMVDGIDKINF